MTGFVIKAFGKYYIRDAGTHLEELYDLNQATVFESKIEANKVDRTCAMREHFKVIPFAQEKEIFDKWAEGGMIRRTIEKIDEAHSREYNNEGIEDVIKFFIYYYKNRDKVHYLAYKTWPYLYMLSKSLNEVQLYQSKDYEHSWITIQISVKKDSEFDVFKSEILLALKYVEYMYEDKYYKLPIVDHELSQYESRYLCISKENKDEAKIINHRDNVLYAGSLEKCFNKMKRDYYYD